MRKILALVFVLAIFAAPSVSVAQDQNPPTANQNPPTIEQAKNQAIALQAQILVLKSYRDALDRDILNLSIRLHEVQGKIPKDEKTVSQPPK